MDSGSVTTPFGRRPMTLGMLSDQYSARNIDSRQSVDKWKLFRALCEAKPMLGITDRALAVLNALLSFYPGNELSRSNGLIVFPSNAQLSIRAHGIAPATLRRHLAALVQAGLLIRKDSPNGKRYARRDRDGELDQAFGFSIAPLLTRCAEIQSYAAQVLAARQMMRSLKERLSLCRRDIAKLVEAATIEGISGDWNAIHALFRTIVHRIPRSPTLPEMEALIAEMETLRDTVLNLLERHINSQNLDANESQIERHIQESEPNSFLESEATTKNVPGITVIEEAQLLAHSANEIPSVTLVTSCIPGERKDRGQRNTPPPPKSFPLEFVLRACPDIAMYGPGGHIASWRDMMAAAITVRTMLGISSSAYQDACNILGPENAAIIIACVLERSGFINSAGGYLRDLTRRAERGEFALGSMLMALVRRTERFINTEATVVNSGSNALASPRTQYASRSPMMPGRSL